LGTYNHKRIVEDWSNGTLTADMAIGHALQHIVELYERQDLASIEQRKLQAQLTHMANKLATVQATLDRILNNCPPQQSNGQLSSPKE